MSTLPKNAGFTDGKGTSDADGLFWLLLSLYFVLVSFFLVCYYCYANYSFYSSSHYAYHVHYTYYNNAIISTT